MTTFWMTLSIEKLVKKAVRCIRKFGIDTLAQTSSPWVIVVVGMDDENIRAALHPLSIDSRGAKGTDVKDKKYRAKHIRYMSSAAHHEAIARSQEVTQIALIWVRHSVISALINR